MSADKPGAVMASTTTVKTMADGTLRVQLDVDPRSAKLAFDLFGSPGTPVALARLTDQSAVEEERKAMRPAETGEYGKAYTTLFRHGFFYNPRVQQAFGVSGETAVDDIKRRIYAEMNVISLAQLPPDDLIQMLAVMGIEDTLPRDFGREGA